MCWPSGRPSQGAELQASYAEQFTREYGCTEAEWLGWLPAALGEGEVQRAGRQLAQRWADQPEAGLRLEWAVLPPRVIGLAVLPRLQVGFSFTGLDGAQRFRYMRRFDLYMMRGGG
ncbi:MAG: hypothetical protein ACOVOG_18035 [Rubrivivax sp.]|jgi:hypothetical protein|nr:hypothetical protein [Rubrivivax sp.]